MTYAIDCARCNSSLSWEGELPDDPAEWLCNSCVWEERDALRVRIIALEAEMAALRVLEMLVRNRDCCEGEDASRTRACAHALDAIDIADKRAALRAAKEPK